MKLQRIDDKKLQKFICEHKILYASEKGYKFYICIDSSEKVYYVITRLIEGKEREVKAYYNQSFAVAHWDCIGEDE